jgi:hypothetical protein
VKSFFINEKTYELEDFVTYSDLSWHVLRDVSAWPGGGDKQGREPLHPPEHGHMIYLDTALGQQLLHVSVGEPIAQIPAHRHHDHLGGNRNPVNPDCGGRTRPGRRCILLPCPSTSSVNATDPHTEPAYVTHRAGPLLVCYMEGFPLPSALLHVRDDGWLQPRIATHSDLHPKPGPVYRCAAELGHSQP